VSEFIRALRSGNGDAWWVAFFLVMFVLSVGFWIAGVIEVLR
jgi:hypothetical protein